MPGTARIRRTLLVGLLTAGCAATPARIPFAQALAEGADPRPVDPKASLPLAEALARFSQRTQGLRAETPRGAAMPEAYARAWGEALTAVEALVATPVADTSALDLARTRVVLETALESDIGHFGDVPPELGQRITLSLGSLLRRLGQVLERPRRVALTELVWPTSPVVVTSSWGDREHPIHGGLHFHAGVDLAGERAQPVHAAAPGTVVYSGWNGGYGKQVELQHDAHLVTRYTHLQSLLVAVGQVVKRGQVIALVGDTGVATGPHLHFEVRRDGEPLDPEAALPPPPPATRASVWR
jgi:murein DD-endopeptidase MepM/ murein hydrolase activator NlpD